MQTSRDQEEVLDALTELVNIGVGRAASSLGELVGKRIELSIPKIHLCQDGGCRDLFESLCGRPETIISQNFSGTLRGNISLCLSNDSSLTLAELLSGSTHGASELDAELAGVLLEVGNIMINGVMGALSNAISAVLTYSLPEMQISPTQGLIAQLKLNKEKDILIGDVRFHVTEHDIQGSMIIVLAIGTIESMMDSILQAA